MFKIGKSMGVVLPADWVRGMDIKAGEELEIRYGKNTVTVAKIKE